MGEEKVVPRDLGLLSEAELATGDPNAAAEAANEGLLFAVKRIPTLSSWLLCARGNAMVALGDRAQGEADYSEALAWSRERNEKWGELGAALGLARLWNADGRARDARDLLAAVHSWFTEGFHTLDLTDARALLDQLG